MSAARFLDGRMTSKSIVSSAAESGVGPSLSIGRVWWLAILVGVGALLGLFYSLISFKTGVGHDEAAYILSGMQLGELDLTQRADLLRFVWRIASFSHGGLNLAWCWAFYSVERLLRLPFSLDVALLPANVLIVGAAGLTGRFCQRASRWQGAGVMAAVLVLFTPGMIGHLRAFSVYSGMIMFLRALLILALLEWGISRKAWAKRTIFVALGVICWADNSFPIAMAQAALALFLLGLAAAPKGAAPLARIAAAVGYALKFAASPWLVVPLAALGSQIAIYLTGHAGMLRYNIQGNGARPAIPWALPHGLVHQMGIGLVLALLWAAFRLKGVLSDRSLRSEHRLGLALAAMLFSTQLGLFFLRDWESLQGYVPHLVPSAVALVILELAAFNKERWPVGFALVGLTAVASAWLVYGPVRIVPTVFGEPSGYIGNNNIRALGTILRDRGINPDYERTVNPSQRIVSVVDGGPPLDKPFFTYVYFVGTAPRNSVTSFTRFILEIDRTSATDAERSVLGLPEKYAKEGFCISDEVIDRGAAVAWIYERPCPSVGGSAGPRQYDRSKLIADFDRKYANFASIKTVDWTLD